jgi:hypothetical protein
VPNEGDRYKSTAPSSLLVNSIARKMYCYDFFYSNSRQCRELLHKSVVAFALLQLAVKQYSPTLENLPNGLAEGRYGGQEKCSQRELAE